MEKQLAEKVHEQGGVFRDSSNPVNIRRPQDTRTSDTFSPSLHLATSVSKSASHVDTNEVIQVHNSIIESFLAWSCEHGTLQLVYAGDDLECQTTAVVHADTTHIANES